VFNIGGTKEITIYDLARNVREMAGSRSEIVCVPYEKAYEANFEDMPRRVPSLRKIQQLLGWQPTIELPEILQDVIDHARAGE
jgi:UDP-glucose 4-epimerase